MKHVHKKRLAAVSLILLSTLTAHAQIKENSYAIENVATGQVIRIKDANGEDGTPIVAYPPVNWKCVTWQFTRTKDGAFTLKNLFSEKTMVPTADSKKLEEQAITKEQATYELIPSGKETYYIKLKGKDSYLTPSDDKGATNQPILLQPKQNTTLQQWKLNEQHPTM